MGAAARRCAGGGARARCGGRRRGAQPVRHRRPPRLRACSRATVRVRARADRLRACGAPTAAGRAQVRARAAAPADRRAPHAARRAGVRALARVCARACEHSPRRASERWLCCDGACGRRGADQAHDLVFLRPGAVVVMVYPYRNAGHSRFRPAVRRCAALLTSSSDSAAARRLCSVRLCVFLCV